ncbi:Tol biopolymer transport system component [Kibdelosporangium banguiense]|uniref:Tol biopolymer transport system component n=1 Tax=Kibdelosporangium banguiense TaxID=1365924 RepID=A0ABS4T753_9PSEU|nr:PD40 domain-containing protein [Kibdelosporangium banguiense]MBP2320239.1 Tol biopolymer transport system component [Kibdelosporangium banguiense]
MRHDRNGVSDIFVKDRYTDRVNRVSVTADGREGDAASYDPPGISADGRHVAFVSSATNLVSGDTNGQDDVFVKNLRTGTLTLVSAATDGTIGNGASYGSPVLSSDGRYIAFRSDSSNLVAGDTNNVADVFIKDIRTGAIARASVGAAGEQGDRLVAHGLAMSADGRYVVFPSAATNLVPGDTNASIDIFVKDRTTGSIVRANTTRDGTQTSSYTLMPSITADGHKVAFVAWGDNLVPGDTEDTPDLFVKDLTSGTIDRVNTATNGTVAESQPYGPVISADGRFVAFSSLAANLAPHDTNNVDDVFLKNLRTGKTVRLTGHPQGNNFSVAPALSADGRIVAFSSYASNLVPRDRNESADIFISLCPS